MMRTRIKICGLTRAQDVAHAIDLGVDALGFVFVEKSPRCVKIKQAKSLIRHMPPFVQTVGLFMNQTEQEIREVLQEIPLNLLQFHGEEAARFCVSFNMPYIKAIPMGGGVDPLQYAAQHPDSSGFLLDSHALGEAGGSGDVFDWQKIPQGFDRPLILAGGLNVGNVCRAVQQVKPYGVDVSSGVEVAKGLKDWEKMAAFVRGVREGDK
ncbi:MAG TPA: phosphoribosylanthranilate isomerase [Gammaproteobacteria bacterium]|nr:phosphoribosylanthranilate isomerase [Gammaproteobacteria bacterium]